MAVRDPERNMAAARSTAFVLGMGLGGTARVAATLAPSLQATSAGTMRVAT
jgi:hypothetical protein